MTVDPTCTSAVKNLLIAAKPYVIDQVRLARSRREEGEKRAHSDEESESYQEEWVCEERVDG